MLQISGIFPDDTPYTFPPDYVFKDGETFDVVVVGAGAAGSAVAARLALAGEDVLLVEAGCDPIPLAVIPAASTGLLGSSIDWKYETISNNKSCLSSIGRACRFPRGKCLGGSTSINNMLYTRGNRQDYEGGAAVPGWTWEHLKPYFLRWEGFQNISRLPRSSLPYHNTSGILKVGFFEDSGNPWHPRIVEGFRSLRFNYNPDVNAAKQIGVSVIAGYVYEGLRMSTARAYLANDKVKSRLKVAKNTLCTGLIIDDKNVATGITVVKGRLKTPLSIYARKEVILSAGTIGTPQILLLSGIGHADHLQEMGIPVRAELPVGDNLIDHVLPLIFVSVDGSGKLPENVSLSETVGDLAQFPVDMGGPLASVGLNDIVSFWNSKCYCDKKLHSGTGCELPTKMMTHSYADRGLLTIAKPLIQNALNLNDDVIDQLAAANSNRSLILFSLVLLRPFSIGTVRLASKDPLDQPAIFPNFMADSRDVDEIVRDIKVIQNLVETPHFKSNNAEILRLDFPDCPNKDNINYWRCYTRHMTLPGYHSVGTCRLRKVVDERLRVLQVQHVRVADISVLPELPRGHPEAIAVAIGEKAADLVLQDNPQSNYNCGNINE